MEANVEVAQGRSVGQPLDAEERAALGALYSAAHKRVFHAVLLVTRDPAAAEDAVAQAFLKASERWSEVSAHPVPVAWLTRVALNDAVSTWRRTRRTISRLLKPNHGVESYGSLDPDMIDVLNSLPLRQRQVIAMRILVGLDTANTARVLGIAEGTVTAHLHRALAACRRQMTGRDGNAYIGG